MTGELIIVVDDDSAVRASLEALLETAGYRTIGFKSGTAFLDSLDTVLGSCALLDVKMPGLDGLEVQRRVYVLLQPGPHLLSEPLLLFRVRQCKVHD